MTPVPKQGLEQVVVEHGRQQLLHPDFFIVGHAKSGTTALYQMLQQHPTVFMPTLKEPEFFDFDLRPLFQPRHAGPTPHDDDAYDALFRPAQEGQRTGEATAFYLASNCAAAQIGLRRPEARIIAIFREPAQFLASLFLQLRQDRIENASSLQRALDLEEVRRRGQHIPRDCYRPQLLRYSDHVKYTEQLRRYRDVFPDDQILVLIYEDFRRDNEGALREVFRFLDVDDTVDVAPLDANPTVSVKSQTVDDMVHRVSIGIGRPSRWAKGVVKAVAPRAIRRRALEAVRNRVVYGTPPAPDPAFMAELRLRLRPEVERFSEYLGRDLVSFWGYDDV